MSEDTMGNDLPTLSKEDEAAFAAEEAAAAEARTAAKGGGNQRLVQEPDHDGDEPAPAPKPAAPAAAPATPTPATGPAAAPAAAPVPAQVPAAGDDDVEGAVSATDGGRYVPVATHISQRKALQGQLKDMEASFAELKKQNELLMKIAEGKVAPVAAPAAAAPVPVPEPPKNPYDEATYPLEHERWERQQLAALVAEMQKQGKTASEQAAHRQAVTEAQESYIAAHKVFVNANPAFAPAYKWVTDAWKRVAMAQGMTETQAVQAANAMEWQTVQNAVERKMHPSQVIWDIAKAAGYVEAPTPAPAAAPAGGGAPAAAAPAPAQTPEQKIQLAQAGAAAAISLSDAAGGSAPTPLTLATVAKMSKEEFAGLTDEQFLKLAAPPRGGRAAVA